MSEDASLETPPQPPAAPALPHPGASLRWLLLALAGALAIYLGLALWFAGTRAIWSPDSGARFIQVQSLLAHWPDWSIVYPAQNLDPHHRNSSLAFYEYNHGGKTYVFYSFLFALIVAPFYKALGFLGLAVPAIAGGLLCVAATWMLGRRLGFRYPVVPALITGLATPLALYSAVFWDHSLLAGIATLALYFALGGVRADCPGRWAAAGVLVGAGVWFHEILAPYLLALLVGGWWLRSRHRFVLNSGFFLLGAFLLIIPLVLVNLKVYGAAAGPHLANNKLGSAGSILQTLRNPAEWGLGALYSLFGWGDTNPAYTWQLRSWMQEPSQRGEILRAELGRSAQLAIPVLLWLPLALSGWWKRWGWVAAAVLLGMAWPAAWVMGHQQLVHSPFYVTPILLLAFMAPLRQREDEWEAGKEARPYLQAMALVTLVYSGVTLLKPTLGGTEWGSRHLLSVVPALVLLGWATVEWLLSTRREGVEGVRWHPAAQPILAAGVVLTVLSLLVLGHGANVAWNMHNNSRRLTDALRATPDEVIVTTTWWVPMNAAPVYLEKKFVFADQEHPAPPLFTRMRAEGVRTFSVLAFDPRHLMDFAIATGYAPVEGTDQPQPFRLWTRRYTLVAEPTDADLPPPPPGETLPPLER